MAKSQTQYKDNLVYKNRFSTIFIYKDGGFSHIDVEMIDVSICRNEKEAQVTLVETFETDHGFEAIEAIVIDLHSIDGEIKVRKVLDVEFHSFKQTFGSESKRRDELSTMVLIFDILDFKIDQDTCIQTLEGFIRGRKMDKFLNEKGLS